MGLNHLRPSSTKQLNKALELHAYYSKMFEVFAVLPPDDIRTELNRESFEHFRSGHYHEWRKVLQRLRSYLGNSTLDDGRREVVRQFVDSEEAINEIMLPYPECRILLLETDRSDLKERFIELIKGQNIPMAGHWVMGIDNRTPDEIQGLCPPVLDEETKSRTEVIKQRLAILDEREAPSVRVIPTKPDGADFVPFLALLNNNQPIKPIPRSPPPPTTQVPTVTVPPARSPIAPLLLNYTMAELTALLAELGLVDTQTGREASTASPGAWVGVIHALLDEKRPRLKSGSKAAIQRAFSKEFNAQVEERTVQLGLGKRGSVGEQIKDRALRILNR